MFNMHIHAYFLGPNTGSGNAFGGLTQNSQKRVFTSSLSFNTHVCVLAKYTDIDANEVNYAKFIGAPPNVPTEYISSASYYSLISEYDAKVGTSSGSFVWEKEEYTQ